MNKTWTVIVLVMSSVIFAGCGDKGDKKSPSQVLAKVNGKEITVLQLNYLLAQQPKTDNSTKQMLLNQLVEQELMVQKAEELKLDRNPDVLQSVEFSKRQMLAQAAVQNMIGKKIEITDADISKFYSEHSNLFTNRNIFDMAVFLLKASDLTKDAGIGLETSMTSEATKQVLQKAGIKFQQTQVKRAAEQIPPMVLDKLMTINNGDIVKAPDENGNLVMMQLISRTSQPISKEDAEQPIRQLLLNEQMKNKAQIQLNAIKNGANIEYLQQFSETKKEERTDSQVPESATNEHFKSGLKGLK